MTNLIFQSRFSEEQTRISKVKSKLNSLTAEETKFIYFENTVLNNNMITTKNQILFLITFKT